MEIEELINKPPIPNRDYHVIDTVGKDKIILCHVKKYLSVLKERHPDLKIYFLPEIER